MTAPELENLGAFLPEAQMNGGGAVLRLTARLSS